MCNISPSSPALWSSSVMYICSGNSLAQRVCVCVRACMAISIVKHLLQGCLHLAVGRYRQCLLQSPGFSLCTVAAVANTALLFQMMSNVDAELEARIVLLKVCMLLLTFSRKLIASLLCVTMQALRHLASHRVEGVGSKCIIWRRECHVSTDCGVDSDRSWWPRALYVTALRAMHCKR